MSSLIDACLQNPIQSPPQEQAQISPALDGPSLASPAVPGPEEAGAQQPPLATDVDDIAAKAQKKQRDKELRALGKTFGNIPNVPIFTAWSKRKECSDAAIHRSFMAGICGNGREGAFSIALSCLYKDDEDGGDVIIYTGAGGRERWTNTFPPKRLRLGPQTRDQSWEDRSNKALIVSYLTGNPVRVIRSWRCPSQYAPVQGYRYDGLYTVTAYWTAKGRNGMNICRCRLERLPDQPPIPVRTLTFSTSRRRNRKRLVSRFTPSPPTSRYDIPDERDVGPNQQQRAMPEITDIDHNMDEADLNMKEDARSLPSQHGVTPKPEALPRFRWDSRSGRLIKILGSHPNSQDFDVRERARERQGEDDALTLVPSEDDGVDVMPATERAETEYFSDRGDSPRSGTPDSQARLSVLRV